MNWIYTKDQEPPIGSSVLVKNNYGVLHVMHVYSEENWTYLFDPYSDIIELDSIEKWCLIEE